MVRRGALLACVCACAGTAAPLPAPLPAPLRGAAPACLSPSPSPFVTLLDADRATIHACFEAGLDACFAIDRTTGAISTWKAPPAQPRPRATPVTETASDYVVCKARRACAHVAKQPGLTADNLQYEISDDGTLAVVTIPTEPGAKPPRYELHHLGAHERIDVLQVDDDNTCGGAGLLGDIVMVTTDVCAGPGGHGLFFDADGKPLGELSPPDRDVNAYDSYGIDLGGGRWAIVAPWDHVIELVDLPSLDHRALVDLGTVQVQPSDKPSFMLVRTADGTLLVASPTGGVAVLDARNAALTSHWQVPACK